MVCDKCGRLSPKGASYCVYCGNSQGVFAGVHLKAAPKQITSTARQSNPKEPSIPSLPPEPKLPSETNTMVNLFNTKTDQVKTGHAQTTAPPPPGSNVATHMSYPNPTASTLPPHYSLPHQGQSGARPAPGYEAYSDGPVDDTPPPGGERVAKTKGAGGCAAVFILIAIIGVLVSLGSAMYEAIESRNSAEESSSYSSAFYDSITPKVDQPVTVLDNDDYKVVIDGGGGVLQGSSDYPRYCVPMLIENKTNQDVEMYFDAITADGIGRDNDVLISPYTNLRTGEQNGWELKANSETLCWLKVSHYESTDRIRNFTATLISYDPVSFDRVSAYPVTIDEL